LRQKGPRWLVLTLLLLWGCATSKQATETDSKAQAPASHEHAGPPPQRRGDVFVDCGIQYGWLDGQPLTLDLVHLVPSDRQPRPVIIYLDASSGGPRQPSMLLSQLVGSGKYVCMRVICVSAVAASDPPANPECASAIRWIAANAQNYDMNPDRIGIWLSAPEGESVCTLERGSAKVLAQSVLGRGENGASLRPGSRLDEVEAFFDRQLRGESPQPPPESHGAQRGGRGRGRMF